MKKIRFGLLIWVISNFAERNSRSSSSEDESWADLGGTKGSYSFDARIKILTEMYCPHQYLKKSLTEMYISCYTYRLVKKKIATTTLPPTNFKKS